MLSISHSTSPKVVICELFVKLYFESLTRCCILHIIANMNAVLSLTHTHNPRF